MNDAAETFGKFYIIFLGSRVYRRQVDFMKSISHYQRIWILFEFDLWERKRRMSIPAGERHDVSGLELLWK